MDLDICNEIAEKVLSDGNHSENGKFSGSLFNVEYKYAMSFIFRKDGVADLLSECNYLKPFVDKTVDTDMYNAFYLNALVIKNNNCVERHIDSTLSGWVDTPITSQKTSVLYLRVPDDIVGGKLNLYEGTDIIRIKPETGKLISFSGETPHSVSYAFTDHERISLVLESYYLMEDLYSKIPKYSKD